jgi:hypothetical protein
MLLLEAYGTQSALPEQIVEILALEQVANMATIMH